MKLLAALAILATTLPAQPERPPYRLVTAVRSWSLTEITRMAVEVTGDIQFRSDRAHNPERVYFDILNCRPYIDSKRFYSKELDDKLVKRVRVAETNPGVTRVVIELGAAAEVVTSLLFNPNRLMIEVRAAANAVTPPETISA